MEATSVNMFKMHLDDWMLDVDIESWIFCPLLYKCKYKYSVSQLVCLICGIVCLAGLYLHVTLTYFKIDWITTDRTHVQRTVSCCFTTLHQLRTIQRSVPLPVFPLIALNIQTILFNII